MARRLAATLRSVNGPFTLHRAGQGGAAALAVVPVLFLAAGVEILGHRTLTWLETWGSAIAFALAAVLCALRAASVEDERTVWGLFAVACTCWAGAGFYYAF